jgi:hypothetical protein
MAHTYTVTVASDDDDGGGDDAASALLLTIAVYKHRRAAFSSDVISNIIDVMSVSKSVSINAFRSPSIADLQPIM